MSISRFAAMLRAFASNRAVKSHSTLLYCFVILLLAAPAAIMGQQLPAPDTTQLTVPDGQISAEITPQLLKSNGEVQVWVQLEDSPLAVVQANAKNAGAPMSGDAQRAYLAKLKNKHDALSATVASLGGRELGRVSKAHNAVAFAIDVSKLSTLAAQPGVVKVRPVIDYSVDLAETVPYIGAAAVQAAGVTGRGVRVAVLDSGIDYTHRNLGGPGTASAYTAAYGSSLDDARNKTITATTGFPTDKVVGGFDFVGEHWPSPDGRAVADGGCGTNPTTGAALACLKPDPNPIACGGIALDPANPSSGNCDGTHGTHVSDILGGKSTDGLHVGVAPGTQLYAVKVCSSVSTSCSGVAMLEGLDFALDPNGDGDISDAVDVVNMSIGSNYGQIEDDSTLAVENAVRLGVTVVIAAGNAADKPYIVSSPSIGPGVISVAQTQVPSAKFFPMIVNSPASIAGTYNNTATVDWAPIDNGFTGNVALVGRGCPAGSISTNPPNPADAYLANPAGKVALIDRGGCSISLKVDRAVAAGAIGVLIGLVAPGDAVSFSFGGGTHFAPTLVITQVDSGKLKSVLSSGGAVNVTVHDSQPLVMSMASTSARGPSYSLQTIKPEIGAPGASVSAIAGTGTGESAFSGTSGATPMVAGSAALLLEAFPHASPAEIKARLMNTAEVNIQTAPNLFAGQKAPQTRIGAGEVRVNRAAVSQTLAWVAEDETAAIAFGYAPLAGPQQFHKKVLISNLANVARSYTVSTDFRDATNQKVSAVSLQVPSSVFVPAHSVRDLDISINVDPSKLGTWCPSPGSALCLNGGNNGGNGQLLNTLEIDGHVTVRDGIDTIRLPWQLLPHRAANVHANGGVDLVNGVGTVQLTNHGAIAGRFDVFAWTGTSKKIGKRNLPQPGDNFAVIDLGQVGVRSAGTAVQFAISTFGKRSHPNYPAEFDIYIDANRDGNPDFVIFNAENGGFGASGQNVVFVRDIRTRPTGAPAAPAATAFFFADADLNSANIIMTAPLSALAPTTITLQDGTKATLPGISTNDPDHPPQFDFSIYAFDNYFTGNLTDFIEGMTFSLSTPRFLATGVPATGVPVGGRTVLTVSTVPGGAAASPSQQGLLVLYRDAAKDEADVIHVSDDQQ